jgi:hypothetical protein
MAGVTLRDLFAELQDQHFENRRQLEEAVIQAVNRHVGELPIGFSYHDAIDAAGARGWLRANGGGHGVRVDLGSAQPAAA